MKQSNERNQDSSPKTSPGKKSTTSKKD